MLGGRRDGNDATGTDMISSIQTRLSMQARRSTDPRVSGDREGLMRAYDEESGAFGLADLADDDSEDEMSSRRNGNGTSNGHATKAYGNSIEMQPKTKGGER
jgi:hypothetical protein